MKGINNIFRLTCRPKLYLLITFSINRPSEQFGSVSQHVSTLNLFLKVFNLKGYTLHDHAFSQRIDYLVKCKKFQISKDIIVAWLTHKLPQYWWFWGLGKPAFCSWGSKHVGGSVVVAVGVSDMLEVTGDTWYVTCDRWHVTRDMWYLTHDTWNLTHDTWFFLWQNVPKSAKKC